jgi:transcriptional/translational regulatory protein YebC/TACO1
VDLDNFQSVREALENADIELEEASVVYVPTNPLDLPQEQALQIMGLIEKIEDLDDVQNVYSTLDITDEAIAAMETA